MWPGIHRLQLWPDSAERLAPGSVREGVLPGIKHQVVGLPESSLMTESTPLSAIYVLVPVKEPSAQAEAAERVRLGSIDAVLAVVRNATLGPLMGGAEAVRLFERACAIAEAAPVYELRYVRDFDRLPEVVDRLMAWHAEPALRVEST
jgi:hypothetical protein